MYRYSSRLRCARALLCAIRACRERAVPVAGEAGEARSGSKRIDGSEQPYSRGRYHREDVPVHRKYLQLVRVSHNSATGPKLKVCGRCELVGFPAVDPLVLSARAGRRCVTWVCGNICDIPAVCGVHVHCESPDNGS